MALGPPSARLTVKVGIACDVCVYMYVSVRKGEGTAVGNET